MKLINSRIVLLSMLCLISFSSYPNKLERRGALTAAQLTSIPIFMLSQIIPCAILEGFETTLGSSITTSLKMVAAAGSAYYVFPIILKMTQKAESPIINKLKPNNKNVPFFKLLVPGVSALASTTNLSTFFVSAYLGYILPEELVNWDLGPTSLDWLIEKCFNSISETASAG